MAHKILQKGDRVMARVSKTTDTAALYAACLQIGALYVPVNPALTQSEAAHYVKVFLAICSSKIKKKKKVCRTRNLRFG